MTDEASDLSSDSYCRALEAEDRKWSEHLQVEAQGEMHAWLDHPLILDHYRQLGKLDGLAWEPWVAKHLGRVPRRSLELGCGSGSRSLGMWAAGHIAAMEGMDVAQERVAEAERRREAGKAPGRFSVADVNAVSLDRESYDLVFSCHSFHHFLALEHVMQQVHDSLTPDGLFVLEEFVGPTQFQWTTAQMAATAALLSLVPERYRHFRWGTLKASEGRPSVAEVVAASPFESIRSADIIPLFERYFRIVATRRLGGTIQHLLYNGIIHHFKPTDPAACSIVRAIITVEDALVTSHLLPSDFMILVGTRRQ